MNDNNNSNQYPQTKPGRTKFQKVATWIVVICIVILVLLMLVFSCQSNSSSNEEKVQETVTTTGDSTENTDQRVQELTQLREVEVVALGDEYNKINDAIQNMDSLGYDAFSDQMIEANDYCQARSKELMQRPDASDPLVSLLADTWRYEGDLAYIAAESVAPNSSGSTELFEESMNTYLDAMKQVGAYQIK